MVEEPGVYCHKCKTRLPDDSLTEAERTPCPCCGSTRRLAAITLEAKVTAYGWLRGRHKRPGVKGFLVEFITGIEASRAFGWVRKYRLIDRAKNRYKERVATLSGEVTRDVDEPLTDHRGHGSDKRKLPPEEQRS
jgi:hypothetical protein